MCGRKDPLWHNRWAEKLVLVKPEKVVLSAKDGEMFVECCSWLRLMAGVMSWAENAEYLFAGVEHAMCDVDPPTPLAAGFGEGLLW
jgi:hypothetical protein